MKILIFIPILFGLLAQTPISNDTTEYEQRLYELHNQYRTAHDLKPLTWDYQLEESARKKSHAMIDCVAKTGELSHECPYPNRRILGVNNNPEAWVYYPKQYEKLGENLTMGFTTPDEAFNALLNSKYHYDNIVNDFTHIGIDCQTQNLICTYAFKR